MTVPTPTTPLPEVPLAEFNAIDTRTASGLFAYRHIQARELMQLPDFGGGDLDAAQRKEALSGYIAFKKPLSALALFLGVVALEDFVRDLTARLASNATCLAHFPHLHKLRSQPRNRHPNAMFKRLDTDPAGTLDPQEINELLRSAIAVEAVPAAEYGHLRDLALLRHTVAHHGAVIRQVDVPRFAHFIVNPGRVINPPPDFVEVELAYIYRIGREIEKTVRSAVFGKIIAVTGKGWSNSPPRELIELIELFGYFGYIESTNVTVGYSRPESELRLRQEAEKLRIEAVLLQRCVEDLKTEFGP